MILDNNTLNNTSLKVLHILISEIEKKFKESFSIEDEISVISYTGTIEESFEAPFMDFIEMVKNAKPNANILLIILTTPGGSAVSVERMVDTVRHNYSEVYFLIPDSAMSAGTIFCMSGDNTHKDNRRVTHDEKTARAKEIASTLSDNKKWHTHGRYINKTVLTEQLKLKIEDYSDKADLRASIREYMKLLKDHIARINRRIFFHSDI